MEIIIALDVSCAVCGMPLKTKRERLIYHGPVPEIEAEVEPCSFCEMTREESAA